MSVKVIYWEMHVAFTGTQRGMTSKQKTAIRSAVLDFGEMIKLHISRDNTRPLVFHHGDCVGADFDFHTVLEQIRVKEFDNFRIEIHPPTNPVKRAFCVPGLMYGDFIHEPEEYLKRNHTMVDASQYLLATPFENHMVLCSGTWATIRYAEKTKRKVNIITP